MIDVNLTLKNIASETEYETPSPIRTVIGMDFDNDGNQELFMNNIDYRSRGAPNTVHSVINSPNVSLCSNIKCAYNVIIQFQCNLIKA